MWRSASHSVFEMCYCSSSRCSRRATQGYVQEAGRKSKNILLAELKACSSTRNLKRGKEIHALAIQSGNVSCIYIASALVHMYAKCGSMQEARQVFDRIKHPNVVSWTSLILGYAEKGEGITALDLFARMKSQGCCPNSVTFVAALKACSSLANQDGSVKAGCRDWGRQIHSEIGCHLNIYVQNTLIDMYAKCGGMEEAQEVFASMKRPDVVSWTALILAYTDIGEGIKALELFAKMKSQGCAPNSITFVAALKACTSLVLKDDRSGKVECRERGKQIHMEIGCQTNTYVQNTLIDMYTKCAGMVEARQVFEGMKHPDVVTWNALISGYVESGEAVTALDLFARMKSQGFAPDCITFSAALTACGLLGALEFGSKLHTEISSEIERDEILVTCLLDFYAKCGSMVEARKVFDLHPRTRDRRTWTALMAGYSRVGDSTNVFELFQKMQDAGFQPDGITFICILTCCSHAGLVDKANEFFEAMSTNYGITPAVEHYTCMIDILSRSNKLEDAIFVLQNMPSRPDAVTWMTILSACAKWKNVEIGRLAYNSLMSLDDSITAAYVLMAHIYGSRGMWEEQSSIREKLKSWKEPGWANEIGEVHMFLVGDTNHPQTSEILC